MFWKSCFPACLWFFKYTIFIDYWFEKAIMKAYFGWFGISPIMTNIETLLEFIKMLSRQDFFYVWYVMMRYIKKLLCVVTF